MTPDEHDAAVAASRAALLDEIGDGHDLVFIRGLGSIGDELIWAGTRNLLEEHVYREINLEELSSSSGDTALLTGSGAWCRSYHEWMPRALAIAELRFDRVIVLPSSFEVGEDAVHEALARTEATVFAREPVSLEAIAGLCRARAAHDCAFFFDFSGYRGEGTGTLDAFRTDREATEGELLVPGNQLPQAPVDRRRVPERLPRAENRASTQPRAEEPERTPERSRLRPAAPGGAGPTGPVRRRSASGHGRHPLAQSPRARGGGGRVGDGGEGSRRRARDRQQFRSRDAAHPRGLGG
jgi:hypothetical protein